MEAAYGQASESVENPGNMDLRWDHISGKDDLERSIEGHIFLLDDRRGCYLIFQISHVARYLEWIRRGFESSVCCTSEADSFVDQSLWRHVLQDDEGTLWAAGRGFVVFRVWNIVGRYFLAKAAVENIGEYRRVAGEGGV